MQRLLGDGSPRVRLPRALSRRLQAFPLPLEMQRQVSGVRSKRSSRRAMRSKVRRVSSEKRRHRAGNQGSGTPSPRRGLSRVLRVLRRTRTSRRPLLHAQARTSWIHARKLLLSNSKELHFNALDCFEQIIASVASLDAHRFQRQLVCWRLCFPPAGFHGRFFVWLEQNRRIRISFAQRALSNHKVEPLAIAERRCGFPCFWHSEPMSLFVLCCQKMPARDLILLPEPVAREAREFLKTNMFFELNWRR